MDFCYVEIWSDIILEETASIFDFKFWMRNITLCNSGYIDSEVSVLWL